MMKFYNSIKNEGIKIKNSVVGGEIEINGTIGESLFDNGYTFDQFKFDLSQLNGDIVINIASFGGDLFEAYAIYDYIRSLKNNVTTKIVKSSASAATVISLAGDKRLISKNSRYLIHKPMLMAGGNSDDFQEILNQLRELDKQIIDLYVEKTNLTAEEVLNLMREEKFISAEEAIRMGFVDGYIEEKSNNLNKETIMDTKNNDVQNIKGEVSAEVSAEDTVNTVGTTEIINQEEEKEEELVEAVEEKEEEVENEETEEDDKDKIIEDLRARIAELEKEKEIEEAENKANAVINFVEESITNGQVSEDSKEEWIAMGVENGIDTIKVLINSIVPVVKEQTKLKEVIKSNVVNSTNDILRKWKNNEITTQEYLNFCQTLKR